jgi:putative membrane protein
VTSFKNFLKGMAMGCADVVPGVSGGTVALVCHIYYPLIENISRLNLNLVMNIKTLGWSASLKSFDWRFLLSIFSGILTSILLLSRSIMWLITHEPILIFSFFIGLIIMATVFLSKQLQQPQWRHLGWVLIGIGLAYSVVSLPPSLVEATPLTFFLGGCVTISAMILPGISGSLMLLLFGLYEPVLAALHRLDLALLGCFAGGCVLGLLSISRLLVALFRAAHDTVFAVLIGLMLGSLYKIWPWKQVLSWRHNSQGVDVPWVTQNVWPQQYEALVGHSAQIVGALVCLVLGMAVVSLLEQWMRRIQS